MIDELNEMEKDGLIKRFKNGKIKLTKKGVDYGKELFGDDFE